MKLAQIARKRAKKRCKKFSVLLMESMVTGTSLSVYRVPCKAWACASCSKVKAQEIAKRAESAFKGEIVRFMSLTIKPASSIEAGIRLINSAWNRLRGKIVRKYGKVKYLKVMENQKNTKMPHFHVLINRFIDRNWLQKAAVDSGFGWHVDIRIVKDRGVLCYVLKYLKKGLTDDDFFSALLACNGRRYGFSRHMHARSRLARFHIQSFLKTMGHDASSTWLFMCSWKIGGDDGYHPLEYDDGWSRWFSPNPDILLLPSKT